MNLIWPRTWTKKVKKLIMCCSVWRMEASLSFCSKSSKRNVTGHVHTISKVTRVAISSTADRCPVSQNVWEMHRSCLRASVSHIPITLLSPPSLAGNRQLVVRLRKVKLVVRLGGRCWKQSDSTNLIHQSITAQLAKCCLIYANWEEKGSSSSKTGQSIIQHLALGVVQHNSPWSVVMHFYFVLTSSPLRWWCSLTLHQLTFSFMRPVYGFSIYPENTENVIKSLWSKYEKYSMPQSCTEHDIQLKYTINNEKYMINSTNITTRGGDL